MDDSLWRVFQFLFLLCHEKHMAQICSWLDVYCAVCAEKLVCTGKCGILEQISCGEQTKENPQSLLRLRVSCLVCVKWQPAAYRSWPGPLILPQRFSYAFLHCFNEDPLAAGLKGLGVFDLSSPTYLCLPYRARIFYICFYLYRSGVTPAARQRRVQLIVSISGFLLAKSFTSSRSSSAI